MIFIVFSSTFTKFFDCRSILRRRSNFVKTNFVSLTLPQFADFVYKLRERSFFKKLLSLFRNSILPKKQAAAFAPEFYFFAYALFCNAEFFGKASGAKKIFGHTAVNKLFARADIVGVKRFAAFYAVILHRLSCNDTFCNRGVAYNRNGKRP